MLILRRKAGETLVIGDDIKVAVLDINEGSVRLAIDAPKQIPILRSELLQAADVNRDAARGESRPQELLHLLNHRGEASGPAPIKPKRMARGDGTPRGVSAVKAAAPAAAPAAPPTEPPPASPAPLPADESGDPASEMNIL